MMRNEHAEAPHGEVHMHVMCCAGCCPFLVRLCNEEEHVR